MKIVLLLVAFVGASLAKPNVDRKELINLLQRFLDTKDADRDPVLDSTLLADVGGEPFRIFPDIIDEDYTIPLDVSPASLKENKDKIAEIINSVSDVVEDVVQSITDFLAANGAPDMDAISDLVGDKIFPGFENYWEKLDEFLGEAYGRLNTGAVAGTVNAANDMDNEPGCDFDGAPKDAAECMINKMSLAFIAEQEFMGISFEQLETEIDGEKVRPCDQFYTYLYNLEDKPEAGDLLNAFKDTIVCAVDNIGVIRERFGHAAVDGINVESGLSKKPMAQIIQSLAMMQHVYGHIVWSEWMVYDLENVAAGPPAAEGSGGRGGPGPSKKKTKKHGRFLSANAKAHTKAYYKR